MSKEQIYDERIAPLMSQIIAVCKEYNIAMIADFGLDPNEDGESLKCTTALLGEESEPGDEQLQALQLLRQPRTPVMLTVRDKDGHIQSSDAIL